MRVAPRRVGDNRRFSRRPLRELLATELRSFLPRPAVALHRPVERQAWRVCRDRSILSLTSGRPFTERREIRHDFSCRSRGARK